MKSFNKLRQEYLNKGLNVAYIRSGKKYSISIVNVPFVVEGIEHETNTCQLTGYYNIYDKEQLQDVDTMYQRVIDSYREQYANNETMLSYVDNI